MEELSTIQALPQTPCFETKNCRLAAGSETRSDGPEFQPTEPGSMNQTNDTAYMQMDGSKLIVWDSGPKLLFSFWNSFPHLRIGPAQKI